MKQQAVEDSECRGSPDASDACDRRGVLLKRLKVLGWCWGYEWQSGAEKRWVRCVRSKAVVAPTLPKPSLPLRQTVLGRHVPVGCSRPAQSERLGIMMETTADLQDKKMSSSEAQRILAEIVRQDGLCGQ